MATTQNFKHSAEPVQDKKFNTNFWSDPSTVMSEMKEKAEKQKFSTTGFRCGWFPERLLNGSPSIQCDGCQSAVSSIITVAKLRGQGWDDRIISIQPVRETVEEEENRLLNRTMAPAWCLLYILFCLLIVCLLFICLCAIKLSQHVLQVALGKQRGANCKLWSLDEVTAECVAAVSRAVSGASMLRSADLLWR